jgi:Ser/Thr protein kinase RdoA (MazF antagonist)
MMQASDLDQSRLLGSADALAVAHVRMTEAEAARILVSRWGMRGHAVRVATEKDDTFVINGEDHHRYVLKVTNPAEDSVEVDFEVQLLSHVARSSAGVLVPQLFPDRAGELLIALRDDAGQSRGARLMSFVPGTPLDSTGSSPAEREDVGRALGTLRRATETFTHRAQHRVLPWDVQHLLTLRPLLSQVADPAQRDLLEAGLSRFEGVTPVIPTLRRHVLHNDFSKSNIIVDHNATRFVQGIIDFGDAVCTAVAIDVATALLNQLPRNVPHCDDVDVFADGRDLLRGYLRVADLTVTELAAIPYLVMGRVVARALITLYRAAMIPVNATYILRNTEQGWAQLRWFLTQSEDRLATLLLSDVEPARPTSTSNAGPHSTGVD